MTTSIEMATYSFEIFNKKCQLKMTALQHYLDQSNNLLRSGQQELPDGFNEAGQVFSELFVVLLSV